MAISPAQDVLRFGLFELDLAAGLLTRQGVRLRLPQQPVQLLALLLERQAKHLPAKNCETGSGRQTCLSISITA